MIKLGSLARGGLACMESVTRAVQISNINQHFQQVWLQTMHMVVVVHLLCKRWNDS